MRMQLDGLGLSPIQLAANKAAAIQAKLHPVIQPLPPNPPCPSDGVPGQGDIWSVTDADVVALRAGKKLYYLTPAHTISRHYGARGSRPIVTVVPGVWNQGLVAGRNLDYQHLNAAQLTQSMQTVRNAGGGGFFQHMTGQDWTDVAVAVVEVAAVVGGGYVLGSALATGGAGTTLTANAGPALTTTTTDITAQGVTLTQAGGTVATDITAQGMTLAQAQALDAGGGSLFSTIGGKVVAAGESKVQSLVTQQIQGALTHALSPASQLTTAPPVALPAPAPLISPAVILAMMGLFFTLMK